MPIKHLVFLAGLVLLNWGAALTAGFMNDDFQIIGARVPESFAEILSPLVTGHVWGVYWRPLIRILYNVLLIAGGHNPFIFHAAGLLFFLCVTVVVYLLSVRISRNQVTALIASALFVVLPSRELPALWIADQVELLVFIFTGLVYLSAEKYVGTGERKYLLLALLMMTGALLSKELAFMVILLPALMWVASGAQKTALNRYLTLTGGFAVLTGFLLSYRTFVIGSNLFAAQHLADTSLTTMIKNFILYIPSVFAGPDQFGYILNGSLTGYVVSAALLLAAGVLAFCALRRIKNAPESRQLYMLGAGWFILFLIPVLPVYMRWYVFTASFGVLLILSHLLSGVYSRLRKPGAVLAPAVIILLVFSSHNIFLSQRWNDAGKLASEIGRNISENKRFVEKNTLVLWGVPDKLNRIPVMKLGQKEMFQYYSETDSADIRSPLRAELLGNSPEIQLLSKDSAGFNLILYGGRFLPEGGKSKVRPNNELIEYRYEKYFIRIETRIEKGYPVSIVYITGETSEADRLHLWFTGREFKRIKNNE